ncbi:MAG TPA: hypothetical protein VK524_27685 [Polyangiaceae bacterium]|nr:hypothetical protein [Polyangiaceae bacterium]
MLSRSHSLHALALGVGVCGALGCGGCRSEPKKSANPPVVPSPPPATPAPGKQLAPAVSATPDVHAGEFRGTLGIVDVKRDTQAPTRLSSVRSARHAGFDRVVFEFDGLVPGYHVEYVDKPVRRCGSGDPTAVAGDAWLEVRMTPADAHDSEGKGLVAERERQLDLTALKELEQTCDFEAHVTWVFGLASPNRYRVLELSAPARLVVDVKHR